MADKPRRKTRAETKRNSQRWLANALVQARSIEGIEPDIADVFISASTVIQNLLAEVETLEALSRARRKR